MNANQPLHITQNQFEGYIMVMETDKLANSYYETIKGLGLEVKKGLDDEHWVILITKYRDNLLGVSFERSDPNYIRTSIYNIYEVNDSNRNDVYRTVEKAQDITNLTKFVLGDKKENISVEAQFYTTSYEIKPDILISYFDCLINGKNTFLELMGTKQ